MSLEQKPAQFNKETLRNSLVISLENYANIDDQLKHIYIENENLAKQHEEQLKSRLKKWEDELINKTVEALKSSIKKEEVLELFSEVFSDLHAKRSEPYEGDDITSKYAEAEFLKDIIIKLLR